MGLLDDLNESLSAYLPQDPQKREALSTGLLSMGAAMLGAPTGNFGRALGAGLQSGVNGYANSYEMAQKTGLQKAQMKLLQNQDARTQQMMTLGQSLFGGAAPQAGGMAPAAPAQGSPMAASPMAGGPMSSAPQAPSQSAQGGFLNRITPDQVVGWQMMGGQDLLPAIKFARQGTEFKPGSMYEMPDGTRKYTPVLDKGMQIDANGVASNTPGYVNSAAEAAGAISGAQKAAESKYALRTLTPAGSGPVIMTDEQVRNMATGGHPAAPAAPAAMPPPASFPTPANQPSQGAGGSVPDIRHMTPDQQQRMFNTAAVMASPQFRNAGKQLGAPAKAPGLALESDEDSKRSLGAVDTTIKASQGLNENWIKEIHNPVQKEGKAAENTLGQLESIKHINLTTGSGTEFKAAATAVLSSLGLATKDMEKYLGNTQKFQQVAMERNMTMLQAQAGPQTDGDSQRAQQTFAKLANTPAANQFIIDLTAANARMAKQKASYYNEALPIAREAGDLTEIDRRWSKIAPSIWNDPALSKYKAK